MIRRMPPAGQWPEKGAMRKKMTLYCFNMKLVKIN
jgi:hypothetical protein